MTQNAQVQAGPTAVKKSAAAAESEAVTIQLPNDVYQWFKQQADADERTVAKYIARELRNIYAAATNLQIQQPY